jgi:hypothetical protein
VFVGKAAKFVQVSDGRRVEHAEHEGRGVVRDGDFDLWQPRAYRQAADQFTERVDELVDGRRKHLAAMHVGNVRRVSFAKTHEYPALGADILHGKSRAAAVIPFRPGEGLEPARRFHAAYALEVVPEGAGLDAALLFHTDVLKHTAATTAEYSASWIDTFT